MELNRNGLAVITSVHFPYGMAATNRIISYSRGLIELNEAVTVLTTSFSDQERDGKYSSFKGIDYKGFRKKNSNSILNKVLLPLSVLKLIFFLAWTHKRYSNILIVSNSPILIILTYLVSRLFGIKYIQEKSEFPFVLNRSSFLGKLYASLYVNNIYKLFDGMIIMTNPLMEYFKDKTSKKCLKIVVPMTVEPERFENIPINRDYNNCITYCGHMGGNKDGLTNLINSFALINKKYSYMKLLLIGSASEVEIEALKKLVRELNISNIWFYGKVSRDEMPNLLANSKLLVLARPSGLQSTGGFPTKLGEYLSTGKPVIVTKVGDIPLYLKDNVNSFLVEPDDNKILAEKINFVLENYDYALKIAEKGNLLVKSEFNYLVQAKRIRNFLYELNQTSIY